MDLQIVNTASGSIDNTAEVNKYNQLSQRSVGISAFHEATLLGNAYSWHAETAVLAAGDTALAVGNESKTKLLVIAKCYVACDLDTQVDFHFPAYPTWAGTAVTGVNLNRSSNKVADATAYADETGNTQGSIFLTGFQHEATAAQATTAVPEWYNFEDAIILGEHDVFAVDVIENTTARFECTIYGYYIDA